MYILLSCLCFLFPVFGQVIQSPTIDTLIEKSEKPFWLVVDLDNTVFEGKEAYGHSHWFDDLLEKELANGSTKREAIQKLDPLWIAAQKINRVQPVEEKLTNWIRQLQEEGVVVLGLTTRQAVLASSTDRQLTSIGIDLSKTAPKGELKTSFVDEVLYEKGVLYANDFNSKGDLLLSFLVENHHKPEKILFVDDKLYNVESVSKILEANGIPVLALHYTAVQERESIYNPVLAKFQEEKLGSLLTNDEALLLLHHQPDIHE